MVGRWLDEAGRGWTAVQRQGLAVVFWGNL